MAKPVAEVCHPGVLHQDAVKEGEIRRVSLLPGIETRQLVLNLRDQHLQRLLGRLRLSNLLTAPCPATVLQVINPENSNNKKLNI